MTFFISLIHYQTTTATGENNTMFLRLMIISIFLLLFPFLAYGKSSQVLESGLPLTASDALGTFHGNIITKWLPDGRKMELLETLVFIDPRGKKWDAPKGHIIDGASIPELAWSLAGGPYSGKYRNASVVHDVACDRRRQDWRLVHWIFYEAMLASGVPESEARIKYMAVHNFGPRWGEVGVEDRLTEAEFRELINSPEEREKQFNELKNDVINGAKDFAFETGKYIRTGLIDDVKDLAFETGKYIRTGLLDDIAGAAYNISPLMGSLSELATIENAMLVLFIVFLIGLLMAIIRRVWVYSLGLFIILFVINFIR